MQAVPVTNSHDGKGIWCYNSLFDINTSVVVQLYYEVIKDMLM